MNLLSLVMAGPTTDYSVALTNDARKAAGSAGNYTSTLTTPIPANATGTWTIGIEGYRNININPGTTIQQTVRDVGVNQITNFSVDGSPVTPRRTVVTQDQCNQCHFQLSAHGTIRNRVQYCVLCHNPNATDVSQRPADQLPAQGIHFSMMIHRIHTGENQESDYTIYGFGGTPVSFADVRFPGDRRDCDKCHVNNSQELPLPAGLLPVVNPRGFIDPQTPTTAACLGCHTAQDSAAHAAQMINPTLGESCAVCHGPAADFSIDRVHAR
jgi:OmcA/MtrC family decaheme c-type cytochrome